MAKPVYMPYIEACPRCGATESQGYSAVDSNSLYSPSKAGEEWHCHRCDRWARFRFASVLKKYSSVFGFPVQIAEGGKKYIAAKMFRSGLSGEKHHVVSELLAEGFDVRFRPAKKDPRIVIVYAAKIGTKAIMKKRQNVRRAAAMPRDPEHAWFQTQTGAKKRAMHRWATRGRSKK